MKKLLLALALVAMYLCIAELGAKQKAEQLCDSIHVGEPTHGLRGRALASGARPKDSGWYEPAHASRQLILTFTGFAPGSDFLCIIVDKNGVVEDKQLRQTSLITQPRSMP